MSPAPAAGTGTYPTLGDAVAGVRAALSTACETALADVEDPDLVKVVPGYYYPQLAPDQVLVEYSSSGTAELASTSTLRTHHELQMLVTLDVERMTNDESETVDRALVLMAAVEGYLNVTSPTLDGAAIWCRLSESRLATSTDAASAADGCVTEIQATFTVRVIVRNV